MKHVVQAIALGAGLLSIEPASAQTWANPIQNGMLRPPPARAVEMPHASLGSEWGSDYWSLCAYSDPRSRERAIRACGRIIGQRVSRTHTAAAHYYRGKLRRLAGDLDEAQSDLNRALDLFSAVIRSESRDPFAYINRAAVVNFLGRYDEALADYASAAAMDDEIAAAHEGRGYVLFRQGDYEGAVEAYDEAARRAPESGGAQASRCVARAAAGVQPDVARESCEAALRLSDTSAYALVAREFLRFKQGDMEGAAEDFANAVEKDASSASAIYGRGVVAVRMGRAVEGRSDIAEAVRIEPGHVDFYAAAGLQP